MKKKYFFIVICLFYFAGILNSQSSVDPNHEFYKAVERWEVLQIVTNLPPLRPYPLSKIEEILTKVIETQGENQNELKIAKDLYEDIFKRPFRANAEVHFDSNVSSGEKRLLGIAGLKGDANLFNFGSIGYDANVLGTTSENTNSLPIFSANPYTMVDEVTIGPFSTFLEVDAAYSFGKPDLYLQAGIYHGSFGSFYEDNITLSKNSKHTGNISFVLNKEKISFSQNLMVVSATNADKNDSTRYPNKFVAMHSLGYDFCKWFSASFYETSVFGGRFDPTYLIPIPYIVAEGIASFNDNIFMGLTFDVKPFPGLSWNTNIFIDDINLAELLKFNFDSKNRGAIQTAVKFVPDKFNWLDKAEISYTAITPYMYAHWQDVTDDYTGEELLGTIHSPNYQTYTTAGVSLGSSLPQNSDRISLSASFNPLKNKALTIKVDGEFIRHANVNESLSLEDMKMYLSAPEGSLVTDGTINNHQIGMYYDSETGEYKESYVDSAWNKLMFLNQETKMYVVKAGIDVSYKLNTAKAGNFIFGAGYTFEYVHNFGVDTDIFPGKATKDDSGNWENTEITDEDVKTAIQNWRSGLVNLTNHYLTLYVKYTF